MFFSDDMKDLVGLFEKHDVRYAVCGGFAVAHHGFIRATMDFDLLVLPDRRNARAIMAALAVQIHGISMKVVSYEDLLFAKRESSRAKDRIDAEELARSRDQTH